jgi:hypothetical protein
MSDVRYSLSDALVTEVPIEAIRADPTRMAQGIMTGIGFLGAGVIFKEGPKPPRAFSRLTKASKGCEIQQKFHCWFTGNLGPIGTR